MTTRARLRWPRAGRALVVAAIRRSPARRAADRRLRARENRRIESIANAYLKPMTDQEWMDGMERLLGGYWACTKAPWRERP